MKRIKLLVTCGLLVWFGGLSWIGLADDQKSPGIQRPMPEGPLGETI